MHQEFRRGIELTETVVTWPIRATRSVLRDLGGTGTAFQQSVQDVLLASEDLTRIPFQMARDALGPESKNPADSPQGI